MKKQVQIMVLPATINPLADVSVYGPGAKLKGTGIYARVRAAFKAQYPDLKGAALKKSVDQHVEQHRPALNALFVAKVQVALNDGVGGRIRRTASGKMVAEIEPLKAKSKLEMSDEQLIALVKSRGMEIFRAPAITVEATEAVNPPAEQAS